MKWMGRKGNEMVIFVCIYIYIYIYISGDVIDFLISVGMKV